MTPRLRLLAVLGLALVTLGTSHVKGPLAFTMDVPSGKWKSLRLRGLAQGVVVGFTIDTSGTIAVAFLNSESYRRFPVVGRPLFMGRVERRLSVSVAVPVAGTYFVVLDNRAGEEARAVTVIVRAARPPRPEPPRPEPPEQPPDTREPRT